MGYIQQQQQEEKQSRTSQRIHDQHPNAPQLYTDRGLPASTFSPAGTCVWEQQTAERAANQWRDEGVRLEGLRDVRMLNNVQVGKNE